MHEDRESGHLEGVRAWTLSEGHVGMETQTRALATALGCDVVVKRAEPPRWGVLPALLWPVPLTVANLAGAQLVPPWPDILITCGRRSVAPALAVKRASRKSGGPGTYLIHIQNPRVSLKRFDTVVVPAHDGVGGDNVIECLGSVHGLTVPRLAAIAEAQRPRFAHLARPLVTVLVGGPSRAYTIEAGEIVALADRLRALQEATGCGLAVVPSRRTGLANVALLRARLEGTGAYIWDGIVLNPYLALIGLADALIVTCDSVNMTCEAAASGKPVYVMMYPGSSTRLDAFHAAMRTRGHTRPFEGVVDFTLQPAPLREIAAAAGEIARRYRAARG
ncbi:MAG: mitochondrial fission protein ELM1 [Alphaproteobacteria bacterium]|jgi:mitochondrial fission protein ELM1